MPNPLEQQPSTAREPENNEDSYDPEYERFQEVKEAVETITRLTPEYAHVTEEAAQMNERLRKYAIGIRFQHLVALQQYTDFGFSDHSRNPELEDMGHSLWGNFDKRMQKAPLHEGVLFSPFEKTYIKKSTEAKKLLGFKYGTTEKQERYRAQVRFDEISVNPEPPELATEPTVKVQYIVQSSRNQKSDWTSGFNNSSDHISSQEFYKNAELPLSNTPDRYERLPKNMKRPRSPEVIERVVQNLSKVRDRAEELGQEGRNNNNVVTIILPESIAQKLQQEFQEHPEYIRPFFTNCAMDLMLYHNPPPYKRWDEENPDRPILLRVENNNGEAQEGTLYQSTDSE